MTSLRVRKSVKQNILKVFFENPYSSFYATDFVKQTKLERKTIGLVLRDLVNRGFIESNIPGNQKGYPNPKFSLLENIRSMALCLAVSVSGVITNKLKNLKGLRFACLTGRFVGNSDTDIDLLMAGNIEETELELVVKKLSKELQQDINYTLLTIKEFTYRQNVKDKGLDLVLSGKHLVIINKFIDFDS